MLVRDNHPHKSTELSDSEFKVKVLEEIVDTVQNMDSRFNTSDTVDDIADVLELLNAYMSIKNIKPNDVIASAHKQREESGTYSKKRECTEDEE